ncbi:MAG: hypothetical protein P8X98_17570, partial [Woeseiaceae bacterium]
AIGSAAKARIDDTIAGAPYTFSAATYTASIMAICLARLMGFGASLAAWKADVLPLSYTWKSGNHVSPGPV